MFPTFTIQSTKQPFPSQQQQQQQGRQQQAANISGIAQI
jgi:hypothetical protein